MGRPRGSGKTQPVYTSICRECKEAGKVVKLGDGTKIMTIVHHTWCPIWQRIQVEFPRLWRPELAD